ncbi:MAG: glycosyltransferase family 2 protein [Chitinophagaceae bacterium]
MDPVRVLFWVSIFIVFYNYIGYPIILFFLVKIKRVFKKDSNFPAKDYPEVTLIIAAYNEEYFILNKIQNCLELDYPVEKLSITFITDGSTDHTPEIIKRFPKFKLLHEEKRSGKISAINRAMKSVQTPYVIFCDANTILSKNAIKKIVSHYGDPHVGGVAGEKKIITSAQDKAVGTGEGLYWRYESFLKKLDSELYSVVGAAGELYSIRTNLFEPVANHVILDDLIISWRVNQKGFRIVYEPEACAMEKPSSSIQEEKKRKIRIAAGGFQSLLIMKGIFNIFKYPVLSFQFISHRFLRWTISPLCLVIILISNILIIIRNPNDLIYVFFFLGQFLFYVAALFGWYFSNQKIRLKVFYLPYYFLFMNQTVYLGFFRFLFGGQTVIWEKTERQK